MSNTIRFLENSVFTLWHNSILMCYFTVGEAPSVLEGIPDVSVLLGEATTLECKINGQPQPSVEWLVNLN